MAGERGNERAVRRRCEGRDEGAKGRRERGQNAGEGVVGMGRSRAWLEQEGEGGRGSRGGGDLPTPCRGWYPIPGK